jgi:hypothetical protein
MYAVFLSRGFISFEILLHSKNLCSMVFTSVFH